MIRTIILAIAILGLVGSGQAQNDDALHDLLTADPYDQCFDYIHNAQLLIPALHEADQIDSVYLIVDFIDANCADHFGVFRTLKNLLDIERGQFDDPLCEHYFFESIFSQWNWIQPDVYEGLIYRTCGLSYRRHVSEEPSTYEQFQSDLTESLLRSTDTLSLEHLYCRYVADDMDFIMDGLEQGRYPGSCLQEEYDRRLAQVRYDLNHGNRTHWSFGMGIWSPRGAAEILGNKAEFSGSFGLRFDRFLVDLAGSMRFLNAAEPYRVHSNGSIRTTEHFFSAYFGLEAGYELVRTDRFGLDLHAGIGYDGIESYDKGDQAYESINSGNLNFGVTPRLFVNETRTRYLGLQFRYNIVNYGTGGGSDLSGNTLSLALVYGSLLNQSAVNEAKRLRYYD